MLENETGKLHILIVEDHRQISDMLADFLIEHGYEISSAFDGKTASSLLTKNSYDLILMDLMLPYKSGEELIRELRTHADTPVICLSAKSQMETRLDVLRMGADDYLLKPFDLNEVLVRIEVVLRRGGAFTKNQKKRNLAFCRETAVISGRKPRLISGETDFSDIKRINNTDIISAKSPENIYKGKSV